MKVTLPPLTRRNLLRGSCAFSAAAFCTPGLFADLLETPQMTEGPFYPDKMPLDTDNDLLVINDSTTPAIGEITHLTGKILDAKGNPIRNAFVEIWQVDHHAVYIHSADNTNRTNQDKNFQGYGRFLTDSKGQYYFRTIKPVPYPGRTPHIHVGISRFGRRVCTTQLFISGHEQNANDGILRGVRDAAAREALMVDFQPIQDSKIGELAANFDVVLGVTPEEGDDGKLHGIGRSQQRGRFRPRP